MAAISTSKTFGDIGEVFIQYSYAVYKIVCLATVAQNIFEAPYLMLAYLDFPTLDLCFLHQLYQGVLIITVIVKGKTEWLAACQLINFPKRFPAFGKKCYLSPKLRL